MSYNLPTEVWDHIANYLSNPEDLLRFALVNSRMRDIVIPTHLNYSKIWTDNCNLALWNDLDTAKAERVRELRVDCVTRDMYTRQNQVTTDPGAWVARAMNAFKWSAKLTYAIRRDVSIAIGEDCLCSNCYAKVPPTWIPAMSKAVSRMTGLHKLVIFLTFCGISSLRTRGFFETLGPHLADLEIHVVKCPNRDRTRRDRDVDTLHEALQTVHGNGLLRFSFCWETAWVASDANKVLDHVARFLNNRCPRLRGLEISVLSTMREEYRCCELWKGRWEQLTRLSLHGLTLIWYPADAADEDYADDSEAQTDVLAAFFHRHDCIEDLRITGGRVAYMQPSLLDMSFGKLRAVHIDIDNVHFLRALLKEPEIGKPGRPIESLAIDLRPYGDVSEMTIMDVVYLHGATTGTIRHFTCYFRENKGENNILLRLVGQCNPLITELTTSGIEPSGPVLRWFPNVETVRTAGGRWLTPLIPGSSMGWGFGVDSFQKKLRELEEALPKLRRAEQWVKQSAGVWRHTETKEEITFVVASGSCREPGFRPVGLDRESEEEGSGSAGIFSWA